jgi:hypothetical protein
MKKLFLICSAMLMLTDVWADGDPSNMLDKVSFQLKAEKWVTTKTADVFVGINAAVADAGIEKIQNQVLAQLAQLSSQGEWHIISYTRQQDKSGLESIQISAEARLPQSDLATIRSKAKAISKPGNTYTVDDVQFTPSEDEITQANVLLRSSIYQQAKTEIDILNKQFPDQKYNLYRIEFNSTPVAMPMLRMAVARYDVPGGVAAAPLNVGNRMEIFATVMLASTPDVLLKKAQLMN